MIHIQELVLDESIDNSLAHSVSYYSVAPTSPPYPGHVYSPDRAKSSGGYSLSRELRQRLEHFDDDISDTVSCIDSPSQDTSVINSLFRQCDDASVDKYMSELVDDSVAEGHGSANHCDSKLKLRKQRSTGMVSFFVIVLKAQLRTPYLKTIFSCFYVRPAKQSHRALS